MHLVEGQDYRFELDYPVLDTKEAANLVLVVFDYMSMPKEKRKNNLFAFDKDGSLVWVGESPENPTSTYYKIYSTTPLVVHSFCSHSCTLSVANGKLESYCRYHLMNIRMFLMFGRNALKIVNSSSFKRKNISKLSYNPFAANGIGFSIDALFYAYLLVNPMHKKSGRLPRVAFC